MGESGRYEYHFVSVIGEGAFSRVYLTEDGKGQRYACKVSGERRLLEREAELLGGLHHPLFPVFVGYEESREEGRLMMEFVPGMTLGRMAGLRGGISARQAMRIAEELAEGLRYLHERQPAILYRDLKPDNIIVCQNGHVKLIDFGCACRQDVQCGARVGTPGFAPPEQLGKDGDGTAGSYSDVYGLARTIQSILTGRDKVAGRQPYSKGRDGVAGRQPHSKGRRQRREEKRCRRRLERMIEGAVREDWKQRPQDMAAISGILTGKRKNTEGILCEKNIWESSYKNSCSLPLI